jgi:sugar/nucleoside kinase (ribokinase family)
MSKHDVVTIGNVFCDMIFYGLPSWPKVGEEIFTQGLDVNAGGMMNTAASLSRLGLKAGITAPLGNDFWGEFLRSKIKEEGVSEDFIQFLNRPIPMFSVALNYNKDRGFVSFVEEQYKEEFQQHLQEVVQTADTRLFHFPASLESGHTQTIELAKKRGKLISLDSSWNLELLKSDIMIEQIKLSDVFMPNEVEAAIITGKEDPYEALDILSKLSPTVVIKLGEKGAICKSAGQLYESTALQVNPIDSTGAGDCFVAGFLYGWLNELNLEACLKIGNYCGGLSVGEVGGFKGAPTKHMVDSFLSAERSTP